MIKMHDRLLTIDGYRDNIRTAFTIDNKELYPTINNLLYI